MNPLAGCDPGPWGPDGGGTQILVALFAFALPTLGLLALTAWIFYLDYREDRK